MRALHCLLGKATVIARVIAASEDLHAQCHGHAIISIGKSAKFNCQISTWLMSWKSPCTVRLNKCREHQNSIAVKRETCHRLYGIGSGLRSQTQNKQPPVVKYVRKLLRSTYCSASNRDILPSGSVAPYIANKTTAVRAPLPKNNPSCRVANLPLKYRIIPLFDQMCSIWIDAGRGFSCITELS